jgi:D-serine deaminase-like pyridoxal phosphate-dependent protein
MANTTETPELLKDQVGLSKHALPTPSLLLDLDVFEANLRKMADHVKAAGMTLRPHAKSHKCPEIAKRQVRAGAIGVCVTTIHEAEALAVAGIGGLLITSPMVGSDKERRLVNLTRRHPDLMSVVDNPPQAYELSGAAVTAGVTLNVLIDLDLGLHRTGIASVEEGLALADKVLKLPRLNLRGISAYSSMSAHVVGYEKRRSHSVDAMQPALELLDGFKKRGFPVEILSGGSTGTYNIDPELKGMTELQAGSYIFMDVDYRVIGGNTGPVFDDFAPSLTVLATVVSKSHAGYATVDAGFKAFATDRPFGPELKGITGCKYHFAGDEHGILELSDPSRDIRLGDKLEFIVPHCDPNVNLYDRIHCLRGDEVESVWQVCRGYS